MFLYSAVLKRNLTRSELQSRFGDKLLGIRVRSKLRSQQSRFPDKLLGIRVRCTWYASVQQCGTERLGNSFRTAIPFRGQVTWN